VSLHPLVEKFLAGQMPEPMAQMLVGGSLPVPPLDLLQALAHAVFQETPLAEKARATLAELPESTLGSAIVGPVQPPEPLALVAMVRREPALLEQALLHEDFNAALMERAVPHLPGPVLEIALNNQVFWIERPAILDLLEQHPEGDYTLKRRIQEFRRDVLRLLTEEAAQERLEIINEVWKPDGSMPWAELPLAAEETEEERSEAEQARIDRLATPVVDAEGNEISLTLTQRVMRLRTNQKILLAQKGGKEERTLLVREANRLIQVAVIRNGRITEGEVAYISQMRTVHDEVLRVITMNREWMKKYPIVRNLVYNPRTPLPLAMNNLRRLNDFDLKMMMKDRNVAEQLRREAKRIVEGKAAGKG